MKQMKALPRMVAIIMGLALFMTVDIPAQAVNVPAAKVSTTINDAAYVDQGWMNRQIKMTGFGINCVMNVSELNGCPVVIEPINGSAICVLGNTDAVDAYIGRINSALATSSTGSASDIYNKNGTYIKSTGSTCYQLNGDAKNWLLGVIQKRLMESPNDIVLKLEDNHVAPATASKSISLSPDYVVAGGCTTSYKTSGVNRSSNIEVAASRLNNKVIMPGQAVSVSDSILPRTVENGYKIAHGYLNGTIVDVVGGGICQVSSTVYNACRNSGMEVLERHAHSMPVSYLPLGMDAAISAGTKDMVFRNPYSVPVVMQATTSGKNLTVNILVPSSALNGHSFKFWSKATGGLSATSYLTTYVNGEEVSTVVVDSSKYRALPQD